MKRFRSILVGVNLTPDGKDISEGGRRAALQAQWLAEKAGASLTLFHSTWADLHEDDDKFHGGPGPEAVGALEALRDEYDSSGVPTELVLSEERSWFEIIRRVVRGQHDLVVVGRRPTNSNLTVGSGAKWCRRL